LGRNGAGPPPDRPVKEAALRCYVPRASTISALLFVALIVLGHVADHTLVSVGLLTVIVISLGFSGIAAGLVTVSAAVIRRRRAAAGACHTCRHPCREMIPESSAPEWPHRPLTRTALPVVAVPRQRTTSDRERVSG
jgi:hypothetical protein